MANEKLLKKMDEIKDDYIKGLQGAVQINSIMGEPEEGAPFGPGPKKALDYALKLGEDLGLKTVNVDNYCGYVEYGDPDAEMVAALGHLDVVPISGHWDYPPFGAEIHDGYIYGRGVEDDKGMTIGAIYALAAIKDLGLKLDRRIRVIFGTNEENGSNCVKHYVESGQEMPVMGFTPDGEFPLIFFEKGMTDATMGIRNPQQGEIKVLSFDAGAGFNIVPEKAELVLEGKHELPEAEGITVSYEDGNTHITAEGVAAHGSKPEKGINATARLMKAVRGLDIGGDFQKFCDFYCEKLSTDTQGKLLGIYYEDEETGKTTVNQGLASWDDDSLSLSLDIRYPKNGKHEEVKEKLEEAGKPYGVEVLERTEIDPLYVSKDSELITKLMAVYREQTGDTESEPLAIGGGTYAKVFPNMVAFGPMFPGDPTVEHQPNERWEIDKMVRAWKIVGQALIALASR